MQTLQVSAVLFAKQLASVAGFYQAVFGVKPSRSDADHVLLRFDGSEFVIHQIPKQFHASASDDSAVERSEAKRLHGLIDESPPPWARIPSAMCSERS